MFEIASDEAARELKEKERSENAKLEKLRLRRAVDKILEEGDEEMPCGVGNAVARFFYIIFAFWGLAIPWREKLRRRTLSRELDRTESENRVL